MSGVIKINDTSSWVKAGDVFDGILKRIADLLPPQEADLHDLLMNGRTDRGVGYCDLRKLDSRQFITLTQAAAAAYLRLVSAGPHAFAYPKYYPGWIKQFENLLDMMKSDPRAENSLHNKNLVRSSRV